MDQLKTYPPRQELDQLAGFGFQKWIKYRFNRSYDDPYPASDMDMYLDPPYACEVQDVNLVGDRQAQEIYETYGDIYVAMSGGIDSEWVAKCFRRQGIPITPIIYEAEDTNAQDSWWAHKWCQENGLTPVVYKEYQHQLIYGITQFGVDNCARVVGGPYYMMRLGRYVRDRGGCLVSGAGFPEYFPDPNISYMGHRYTDAKFFNSDGSIGRQGWLIHETDIHIDRNIGADHPAWNFLSWRPDIVLAYMAARNSDTSEHNKARIFDCAPRPKSIGVADWFWRGQNPIVSKWNKIKNQVGNSEAEFIGDTAQLMAILTTGDINAQG